MSERQWYRGPRCPDKFPDKCCELTGGLDLCVCVICLCVYPTNCTVYPNNNRVYMLSRFYILVTIPVRVRNLENTSTIHTHACMCVGVPVTCTFTLPGKQNSKHQFPCPPLPACHTCLTSSLKSSLTYASSISSSSQICIFLQH